MRDRDFLMWLHNRLVNIHKDSEHADHMYKLREIIAHIPADQATPNMCSFTSIDSLRRFLECK